MTNKIILFKTKREGDLAYKLHTESDAAESESFACAVLDISKQYDKRFLDTLAPTKDQAAGCILFDPMGSETMEQARKRSAENAEESYKRMKAEYDHGVSLIQRAKTEPIAKVVREDKNARDVLKFYSVHLADHLPFRIVTVVDATWSPETSA